MLVQVLPAIFLAVGKSKRSKRSKFEVMDVGAYAGHPEISWDTENPDQLTGSLDEFVQSISKEIQEKDRKGSILLDFFWIGCDSKF